MLLNHLIAHFRRPFRPSNRSLPDPSVTKSVVHLSTRNIFCGVRLSTEDFTCNKFRGLVSKQLWKKVQHNLNERLALLGRILMKQCNFYAAHRTRRANQIWNLYARLYTEKGIQRLVLSFISRLRSRPQRPLGFLLGMSLFNWEKEKITDDEMRKCVDEFEILCKRVNGNNSSSNSLRNGPENGCNLHTKNNGCNGESTRSLEPAEFKEYLLKNGWEPVIENENIYLWRRYVTSSARYEYKVFGTFYDISAQAFFTVQMDTEYRKKWDKLVIKLDVVDQNEGNACEVIHWVMHYPFPMYSRDYVFIRRALVDLDAGRIVLMSRSTAHPSCPENDETVRVYQYTSHMVIRPHEKFEENGFDYLLTYFDDPRASFPGPVYSWMASSGIPDFVEKLHAAAKGLHGASKLSSSVQKPSNINSNNNNNNVQCVYA